MICDGFSVGETWTHRSLDHNRSLEPKSKSGDDRKIYVTFPVFQRSHAWFHHQSCAVQEIKPVRPYVVTGSKGHHTAVGWRKNCFTIWRKWSHFQIPNQIYQNTLYIRKYIYAFGLWIQMVYMWLAFLFRKRSRTKQIHGFAAFDTTCFFCKSTFADICGKLIFGVSPQNRRFWKMHRPSAAGTPWCEKNDGGGRWWNTCHIPIVCCNCVLVKSKHKRLKTFPNREWFEVLNHIYMNHGRVKVCFLLVCVISTVQFLCLSSTAKWVKHHETSMPALFDILI